MANLPPSATTMMRKEAGRRSWLWPAAWASVIFATSCRFIDRDAFIRFIAQFLPAGPAQAIWVRLWMLGGLVIVKGYHMAEYALLFCLVAATLQRQTAWPTRRAIWIGALCSALFAASDEWHQTFVPGRGGTVRDVVIDCAGIALAATVLHRRSMSRKPDLPLNG